MCKPTSSVDTATERFLVLKLLKSMGSSIVDECAKDTASKIKDARHVSIQLPPDAVIGKLVKKGYIEIDVGDRRVSYSLGALASSSLSTAESRSRETLEYRKGWDDVFYTKPQFQEHYKLPWKGSNRWALAFGPSNNDSGRVQWRLTITKDTPTFSSAEILLKLSTGGHQVNLIRRIGQSFVIEKILQMSQPGSSITVWNVRCRTSYEVGVGCCLKILLQLIHPPVVNFQHEVIEFIKLAFCNELDRLISKDWQLAVVKIDRIFHWQRGRVRRSAVNRDLRRLHVVTRLTRDFNWQPCVVTYSLDPASVRVRCCDARASTIRNTPAGKSGEHSPGLSVKFDLFRSIL